MPSTKPVSSPGSKAQSPAPSLPRSAIQGSIEFKQAIIKRCFIKMAVGMVLLSPLLVTQAQHRFGQPGSGLLVLLFFPLATALFVFACMDYARSKGMHPAMGFLGLGSIFGLMVLSFWPDRYVYDPEAKKELKAGGSHRRKS